MENSEVNQRENNPWLQRAAHGDERLLHLMSAQDEIYIWFAAQRNADAPAPTEEVQAAREAERLLADAILQRQHELGIDPLET